MYLFPGDYVYIKKSVCIEITMYQAEIYFPKVVPENLHFGSTVVAHHRVPSEFTLSKLFLKHSKTKYPKW